MMAGTIALGANHYDTLGLEPGATEEQIRQAFAREMAMFRPMADTARIGLAFETLRNPARRRAYDAMLGLHRKPAVTAPPLLSLHMSARFDPPVAEKPASRPAEPSHDAVPPIATAPPAAPWEQTEAPFIAVADDPSEPDMERLIGRLEAIRKASSTAAATEPKSRRFEVNPALAIGGLLAAAVVVGIWGGLHAGGVQEAAPTPASASGVLPSAKPLPKAVAAQAEEASLPVASEPQSAPRWARAEPRRRRSISRSSEGPIVGAAIEDSNAAPSAADASGSAAAPATIDAVAEPSPATATPAAMPLPNAVVARTIQRIGYSCGRVSSTAAVEGEPPGTFKVTCASGQSYQAKPVGGRYRFRRLNGQ
jgi:curved DNA-binding protein CbpA